MAQLHEEFYRLNRHASAAGQASMPPQRVDQGATPVSSAPVHNRHVAMFNPLERERPNGDSRRWIGHYVHIAD